MQETNSQIQLTGKQEQFCQEYLIDLNGTQAAIRAGYSKDSAAEIASENLRKPNIQDRLFELRKAAADKFDITRERIIQEYARIAFSDIRALYDDMGALKPVNDLSEDVAASIAGIEVDELDEWQDGVKRKIGITTKVRRWDKKAALDSLCRVLGHNAPEKAEITGKGGIPLSAPVININIVSPDIPIPESDEE